MSQRSGFSCQSAGPDMAQFHRISVGGAGFGGGGGGSIYRQDIRMGSYQGTMQQQNQIDQEPPSMPAMGQYNNWMVDGSDVGSVLSERDAAFNRQYSQSIANDYTNQVRQTGGSMAFPMHRSLSGTLSRGGGMAGREMEIVQQQSFKGPAYRTINRITNRNRMSMGSMSGTIQRQMSSGSAFGGGGDIVDGGFIASRLNSGSQGNLMMQRPGTLSRAMSVKSMHSVGRGMDVYGRQLEIGGSMSNLNG